MEENGVVEQSFKLDGLWSVRIKELILRNDILINILNKMKKGYEKARRHVSTKIRRNLIFLKIMKKSLINYTFENDLIQIKINNLSVRLGAVDLAYGAN
ncbi:hypothetical protein BpHYR1_037122 [Brachionus plicatilis]|uniref:Uncharacterized protein n=1 Tax=Brachionus plicatilis TaxID=10195 RepID=A0A3M7SY46_BRAPC|nr:hypothetical protein BpHYR1_037122 [Brachionus plicatilis]